ncbi:MAG: hypothetical protein JNL45_13945 [Hyphomicrobium sp.]|jgi:hypothetical protein|nr:hypothetical protein [Hyphomicrobium sp.]
MMEAVLQSNDQIVQAIHDAKDAGNEEAAKSIQRRLEAVLANNLIYIMNPIGEQYPDLYPEALRPRPRVSKGHSKSDQSLRPLLSRLKTLMSNLEHADNHAVGKILKIEQNDEECKKLKDDTVWPIVTFQDIAAEFVLSVSNNIALTADGMSIFHCYPIDCSLFSVIQVLCDFSAVFGPFEVLQSSGGPGYYIKWMSEDGDVTLTLTFGDGRRRKDTLGMIFIYRGPATSPPTCAPV